MSRTVIPNNNKNKKSKNVTSRGICTAVFATRCGLVDCLAVVAGRAVAIDYMKARYESGKTKEPPASVNVPKVLREPKKLNFEWDKYVTETVMFTLRSYST